MCTTQTLHNNFTTQHIIANVKQEMCKREQDRQRHGAGPTSFKATSFQLGHQTNERDTKDKGKTIMIIVHHAKRALYKSEPSHNT